MATVKIYRNTSDKDMNVVGIGEIPAGGQLSMHTDYHPPVILDNYPGLIEVSDEPGPDKPLPQAATPAVQPAPPVNADGLAGDLTAVKNPGEPK